LASARRGRRRGAGLSFEGVPARRSMESLPGAGRRDAYEKVKLLCDLRLERTHSEKEIAEKLNFGSPEAMHTQLEN
jgi:hypothetical protein